MSMVMADTAATSTSVASRRGLLGRLGAAMVGAAMLDVLRSKQALACPPPGQCYGLESCGCHGGGCPGTPSGGCCWVYVDEVACRVYKCCDHTCADGTYGICIYQVCRCC